MENHISGRGGECVDNPNYAFFEEFKRLDQLCGDLLQTSHGVTAYIDTMKQTQTATRQRADTWERDLKQLIRLRKLRNYLAHQGSFSEKLCTREDVAWLLDFRKRILRRKDPLILSRQQKKTAPKPQPTQSRSGISGSHIFSVCTFLVMLLLVLFLLLAR